MSYYNHLTEGYLLSDKTITVNYSKFESDDIRKLLIVGVAGSGKTTLGEKLAQKMRIKWYSIDSFWWRLKQEYNPKTQKELDSLFEKKVMSILKSNERCIIEGINLLEDKYRPLVLKQAMIILGLSSIKAGLRAAKRNRGRGEDDWRVVYQMPMYNIREIEPHLKSLRKDIKKISGVEIQIMK